MSFYDDASLVFLPSGGAGKDGKAYSIKPTDGSGDFTFSRGNNLTATRVDSNGLIEKGRENLLLQSNQFDTTWTTSGTPSLSSGQSGYDGSTDAWLYTNNGSEYIYQDETTNVATYSIFAKKGNGGIGDFVLLFTDGVGGRYFDLDNGVLGSEVLTGLIDSKIELVSGTTDWYRCSITFASSTRVRVYASLADNDFASVASIYIQDAQVEIGLVATEYIESGATTGKAGLLEDSPRFDYSGGASCPILLLEPSRTNLVKHSEYIDTSWVGYRAISTQNVIQSPSGTNDAALIYEDSVDNSHYFQTAVTTSSSTTYTQSAFVKKKDSGIYASLRTNGVGGNSYIIFDFDTATIVDEGSDIISSGVVDYSNGWYRIYMTYTLASIGFIAGITNSTTNPIPIYLGTGKGYYLWGAQMEEGSYPTSYIPNHSGGSVTREAESFEKTGLSSVIGQTEGTIFFEFEYFHQQINIPFFRVLENASNFYEIIALSGFKLRSRARIGGSVVANITTSSVVSEGTHKAAIIYKSGDYRFYLDGSLVGSSTESSVVSNPSEINYFDNNNNLKQFLIFPTALSDADCITLTS